MSDSPSAAPVPQPLPPPADGAAALAADLEAAAGCRTGSPFRARILAAIDRPLAGGFAATLGVLGALVLGSALLSISTILVYIVLALFLALGLDPIVRMLERHNVKRGAGIGIVFGAFALLMTAFLVFVVPPVLAQIVQFFQAIPQAIDEMPQSEWFLALPAEWQVGPRHGDRPARRVAVRPILPRRRSAGACSRSPPASSARSPAASSSSP